MDAIEAGRDVMVFSDNVPVEQEVRLKEAAAEQGLLVMGPDCGTAVVGGLGLGFANVVQPGPVGLVAASGTGCQQVLTLLDHAGVGVTHALGVGGRDLSAEVGGRATREALRRLDADAVGRADRPGLQAAGRRGRGGDPRLRRLARHAGRVRPPRRRPPRPDRGDRGGPARARPRGAGLAGRRRSGRRRGRPVPARPLRRRHDGQRGADHRHRAARLRRSTRSSTSATTSTRPAARTR